MMEKSIKAVAAGLIALSAGLTGYGMPAKPGLIKFEQSDGTVVEARLIGDEYNHMYVSPEGYPLVAEGKNLYYAEMEGGAHLKSTGIRALPMANLSAAERSRLAGIKVEEVPGFYNGLAARADRGNRYTGTSLKAPAKAPAKDDPSRFLYTNFPNHGYQKALVILVQYSDVKFTLEDPHDYFSRMMNEPGFSLHGGTGSARDFFRESSCGQFDLESDVFGPVTLPETRAFYGSGTNDPNAWRMVADACRLLDDEIDFSQYDRDGDGYVDNVYVFYAGEGESSGGGEETVWPHAAKLSYYDKVNKYIFDGKIVDSYATSNEWENGDVDGVGTFCHEFSHVMGLPDLYPTDYSGGFSPGPWSALDYGPYNNDGRTPPLYSAFERYCVGWMTPEEITGRTNINMYPISTNTAYRISTSSNDEFYILENRQQVSWDEHLPGHGMLVWHIDFDAETWRLNRVNNTVEHQRVDIEEADADQDINSRDGDAFPGTDNVTSFTDDTNPSMMTWGGNRLSLPLTQITEHSNGVISLVVSGGYDAPGTPAGVAVSAVTSRSAKVEWDAVEGATDYQVVVMYDGLYDIAANYFKTTTDGATSLELVGLAPSTPYRVMVAAEGKSATGIPSEFCTFSTLEAGFEDIVPDVYEASDVTENSFTATWNPVEDADSYVLSVYTKEDGEPHTIGTAFAGGASDVPEGWETNSRATYNMASMAGKAAPSLRLSSNGTYLSTGEFAEDIRTLSFWHRGSGAASAKNHFLIEGLTAGSELSRATGEWIDIATVDVVSAAGGATKEITEIPAGVKALKITYVSGNTSSVGIDDVIVGYGAQLVRVPVTGYDNINVGDVTSVNVTGLEPEKTYYFVVKGQSGDKTTYESAEQMVYTPEPGSVEGVSAAGAHTLQVIAAGESISILTTPGAVCRVVDVAGRAVASASADANGFCKVAVAGAGLYIVADSEGNTAKIIVK